MELQYYGANCVRLTTKKASIVIDDNLASVGLKSVVKPDDVVLYTYGSHDAPASKMVIDMPGEYEVSDISIKGVAARSHMAAEAGAIDATIYQITLDDIRIAVVGHVYPELSEAQLEEIGIIDVLIVPVGGNGYTLDGVGALKVIKEIEPKLIIPTHYADSSVKYEVPQNKLEDILKEVSMEPAQTVPKLKLKHADLPEIAQLIVVERQ